MTAATFKMELVVIIVNGFQLLTIIRKSSILDAAVVLNPPLYHAIQKGIHHAIVTLTFSVRCETSIMDSLYMFNRFRSSM